MNTQTPFTRVCSRVSCPDKIQKRFETLIYTLLVRSQIRLQSVFVFSAYVQIRVGPPPVQKEVVMHLKLFGN